MTIETIRQLMNDNPPSPTEGYVQEVRDAVASYARRRREDGVIWSELVAEVGVSSASMRNWMRMLVPARFHQVVVVDEQPANQVVAGAVVECVAVAAHVLEELVVIAVPRSTRVDRVEHVGEDVPAGFVGGERGEGKTLSGMDRV